MSSKNAHIEKALRNETALKQFNFEPDLYEWYITVSFYAAVHWLRAYFAQAGRFTSSTEQPSYEEFPRLITDMYRAKASGAVLLPVRDKAIDAFLDLKRLSQRARYDCRPAAWYARHTGDADTALKVIRAFVEGEGVTP